MMCDNVGMPRVGGLEGGAWSAPYALAKPSKFVTKPALGYPKTDALDALPKGVPAKLHPKAPVSADEVMVASYNIENLFDTVEDKSAKDNDQFTPDGDYKWTEAKLAKKIANLGDSVRAMNGGKGPDILALNEVENAAIVERLRDEGLAELGYTTLCHLDTEDKRGIDNAILSRWPLIGEPKLHTVHNPGDPLWKDQKTRGILEATFDVKGVPLTVFVNHWPAGVDWPERKLQREDVGKQLRAIIEAKLAIDPEAEIMVMGDFNASPGESSFGNNGLGASGDPEVVKQKKAPLYGTIACLADQIRASQGKAPLKALEAVDGLLKDDGPTMGTHWDSYSKKWNTFDQIFVSRGLLDDKGLAWVSGSTQIGRTQAITNTNGKPRSTFPNGTYSEHAVQSIGVSDHYPLIARLVRKA